MTHPALVKVESLFKKLLSLGIVYKSDSSKTYCVESGIVLLRFLHSYVELQYKEPVMGWKRRKFYKNDKISKKLFKQAVKDCAVYKK